MPPCEQTIHWQIHTSFHEHFVPLHNDIKVTIYTNDYKVYKGGILWYLMEQEYHWYRNGWSQPKFKTPQDLFRHIYTESENSVALAVKYLNEQETDDIQALVRPFLVDMKIRTSLGLRFKRFIEHLYGLTSEALHEDNEDASQYPGITLLNHIRHTDMRWVVKAPPIASSLCETGNTTFPSPNTTASGTMAVKPSNAEASFATYGTWMGGAALTAVIGIAIWVAVNKFFKHPTTTTATPNHISIVQQPQQQMYEEAVFKRTGPYNDHRENLLKIIRTHTDFIDVDDLEKALRRCSRFLAQHTTYNQIENKFLAELRYIHASGEELKKRLDEKMAPSVPHKR